MYLLSQPPRTNIKMGRLSYGQQYLPSFLARRAPPAAEPIAVRLAGVGYGYQSRLGMNPRRLPNLGAGDGSSSTAQRWRRLSGLGDTLAPGDYYRSQADCDANPIDPYTGELYPGCGTTPPNAIGTPTNSSGKQNPSPTAGGASNGGITTVLATTPSQSPLDYVSPQAAIAAGLDPQKVYNAWTAALARFPSPQAAIAAGVPAGVVNQLWQQSNVNAANKAAASASSGFFGLSTTALLGIGGGVALLALLGGKRGR